MKKIAGLMILLILIITSACGMKQSDASKEVNSDQREETSNVVEKTGVYVGQIDGHTIEISINGEGETYYTPPAIAEEVLELEDGVSVNFSYFENDKGRYELTKIKAVD